MFTFLLPRADGTVYHLRLGGLNISDAFEQFAKQWWTATDHTRAIGIWQNSALVARVIPVTNADTGEPKPMLQHWP